MMQSLHHNQHLIIQNLHQVVWLGVQPSSIGGVTPLARVMMMLQRLELTMITSQTSLLHKDLGHHSQHHRTDVEQDFSFLYFSLFSFQLYLYFLFILLLFCFAVTSREFYLGVLEIWSNMLSSIMYSESGALGNIIPLITEASYGNLRKMVETTDSQIAL